MWSDKFVKRAKKHSLDATLWTSIALLRTGMGYLCMEGVVEISSSVIHKDFWTLLSIIVDVLFYERQQMTSEERHICEDTIAVSHKTVALVDGVDFSVVVGRKFSKSFYSRKVNVCKQHAIRAQIRVQKCSSIKMFLILVVVDNHQANHCLTLKICVAQV